ALGRRVAPERVGQLVAGQRPQPMSDEIDEDEPPLAAGQRPLEPLTVTLDRHPSADLDPERQPGTNIPPTGWRRTSPMPKLIRCECGFVAHGATDDEVIEVIRGHMRSDHPQLLAEVSRDDLVGWIEEG